MGEFIDTSKRIWKRFLGLGAGEVRRTRVSVLGVPLDLVWCPPGTFWMGSPEDEKNRHDDETRHRVTLTKGFWIGKYAVTQTLWVAVMDSNPSRFRDDDLPVAGVSWEDCQRFCQKSSTPWWQFRLPTEAEWEYACRAGTKTAFSTGDKLDSSKANFGGDDPYLWGGVFGSPTKEVGSYLPNAWGLYDVHGNVEEWCHDWYGEYSIGAVTDPSGPAAGLERVVRGGSWCGLGSMSCRSAARWHKDPSDRSDGSGLGFRVVGIRAG